MKKVRTEGVFIDKKREKLKRDFDRGKFDDEANFLQNSPTKSLRGLGQEAGISKASAWRATKLLKSCIMVIKNFLHLHYSNK